MIFSHTQVSNYLGCPRRYRYRYLDGWEERLNRAAISFGRIFEQALGAYFRGEVASDCFRSNWELQRESALEYSAGDNWEKCLQDGLHLLELFSSQGRVQIADPVKDLSVKLERRVGARDQFVAYIDAIGSLDGIGPTILDWKTTSASYPSSPDGIVSLDQQLIAYSWATGIPSVGLVAFVRKKKPEVQYLRASISEAQRTDYARLIESTVSSVRAGRFEARPGIRFPQNGCLSCGYLGLCLGHPELATEKLERKANLVWIDQLAA